MKVFVVHQNFPGQFRFLAPALIRRGHEVIATTMQQSSGDVLHGLKLIKIPLTRISTPDIHPWVTDWESKVIRGEALYTAALSMKNQGYEPDVIIAHPGWGETLFIKKVWPKAKLGIYCEFYYSYTGADVGFDKEFASQDPGDACRLELKNINSLLHFQFADAGISPTKWQASTFPESFRSKISVIHDGIDCKYVQPDQSASLEFMNGLRLTPNDEIITFVNRNLEPYRGYHIFMRALPEILKRRPDAKILIVGGDGVSYGVRRNDGRTWKDVFIDEVRHLISDADWKRVLFTGNISYPYFLKLLQISTVHVYLTYPFVLSWSLLEAMSVGCAIVASDTPPVREVITHNQTGLLVDFFDVKKLTENICDLLDNEVQRVFFGANAREFVKSQYDLRSVCLPKQIAWVESLIG